MLPEWSALIVDRPEAWERVKYAGWNKPFSGLNVVNAKEGEAFEPNVWCRFYDAICSSGARVAVSLKKVVMMKTLGRRMISLIIRLLDTPGTPSQSHKRLQTFKMESSEDSRAIKIWLLMFSKYRNLLKGSKPKERVV